VNSGYQYSIIDLQGRYDALKPEQENSDSPEEFKEKVDSHGPFIDMEFTTSNLYHFTSQMLIEEFVRLHNIQRVTMFHLNERMSRLEEQVTEMKNQITAMKNQLKHLSEQLEGIVDLKK
jgi:hypothetical protein